jgi:hypothetical protein
MRSNGQRSDLERLQLFAQMTEELRASRLMQSRPDIGLTINWNPEEGMQTEVQQPDEEELRSFLMTFRKFFSEGEDVHFNAICNIAERRLEDDELRERLRAARELWKYAMREGPVGVTADDRVISPEHVLDLFINGWYFHNDLQKEAELGGLLPGVVRYRFLAAVLDATKAVMTVGELLRRGLAKNSFGADPPA